MSAMPSVDAAGNWNPDRNRFNLPKPPEWFLKTLWDQDAALVVLPSRQARKYVLARRRSHSLTAAKIVQNERMVKQLQPKSTGTDADMLAHLNLVHVDSITHRFGGDAGNGSWMRSAPAILSDLRSRDQWAAGGADKYVDQIEASEAEIAAGKRAALIDRIDHSAADAYRSYKARTGQRNQR